MNTSKQVSIAKLKDVPETLLYPLKSRYIETQKKNGILSDSKSVEILDALDYNPTGTKLFEISRLGVCLRTIIFDEQVTKFLQAHPDAVVVNIGCGLDTRFSRIDNGRVLWFDIDLPESIALRQQFFKATDRHRFIAKSALDPSWADEIPKGKATLFIIEGLSFYFTEEENKNMLKIIGDNFPGADCLIEIMAAWYVNIFMKMAKKKKYDDALDNKAGALLRWGINTGRALEKWPVGLRFVEEWFVARRNLSAFPFQIRLMFYLLPIMSKSNKIVYLRMQPPASAGRHG